MKLASPRELNTKLQEQKSSEVKAGMFLAKKVDALREEVQTAQVEHDRAIERMESEYANFMTEQSFKRENLKKEIESLIEQRKLLLIPLEEEWSIVTIEKNRLVSLETNLLQRESKVIEDEKSNQKIYENNLILQGEIEISKIRTREFLEEASEKRIASEAIISETKEYEKQTKEKLEIRSKAVSKRETDVAYREIDAENKWKNALSKEEDNRKETLRIESKQRQLSAAFAELNRKNAPSN